MRKDIFYFGVAIAFIAVISSGFSALKEDSVDGFHLEETEVYDYRVPSKDESEKLSFTIPYTGKTLIGFKQALAVKESAGIYDLVNAYGYMGKYQFGRSTLRNVGVYDFKNFLKNPALQEEAIEALLSINKWELRKEIRNYSGRVINGIKITESGLLAAAHLAGASSVKTYLRSNGKNGFKDGFGTSLKSYIKRFNGYDTSTIYPNRFAKVTL
ncbi:peptidoglycan-binding protein LysM [Flavobacterium difficile]|uniref:Peptidoglycan-binding protein LysM n=1 Tax=Flavobacterium difficile TaxID=2709659 RepID=A0ABX0I1T0_9FLAO|nr:peptidoglycan-binding protein LysM [Flavobacterium difficile]NHM01146.1 peptidoglycan-binding protein LysM [Flavobacterium difficile]